MSQSVQDLEKAIAAERGKVTKAEHAAEAAAAAPGKIRSEREALLIRASDGDAAAADKAEKLRALEAGAVIAAEDAATLVRLRRAGLASLERQLSRAHRDDARAEDAALVEQSKAAVARVQAGLDQVVADVAQLLELGRKRCQVARRIVDPALVADEKIMGTRIVAAGLTTALGRVLPQHFRESSGAYRRDLGTLMGELLEGRSMPAAAEEPAA